MKYIDAEKLYEKIDALMEHYTKSEKEMEDYDDVEISVFYQGKRKMCSDVLDIIDSLQQEQPEADLEKEIEEHAIFMPHGEFASDNEIQEDMEWAKKEFRHFYELGLKARKEE